MFDGYGILITVYTLLPYYVLDAERKDDAKEQNS